ncbi:MAG: 3-oxoacyl-ACP synthase, partial [Muribaculaceae bacterium]|nr:3-oxoacyl-ACP synthase [Muribaculaceae bacterium]
YGVRVGGYQLLYSEKGDELITKLYKEDIGNYPKFYKMDMLSRLAFVTSEELIPNDEIREVGCDNRAIILFNNSSSIDADRKFVASIDSPEGFFPSPSVFVYTLPNMSTAEIAMRNKYYGETSFYIIDKMDYKTMQQVVKATLLDPSLDSAIYGWVDYKNSDYFLSDLHYIEKNKPTK